jgi:hypothetical protein
VGPEGVRPPRANCDCPWPAKTTICPSLTSPLSNSHPSIASSSTSSPPIRLCREDSRRISVIRQMPLLACTRSVDCVFLDYRVWHRSVSSLILRQCRQHDGTVRATRFSTFRISRVAHLEGPSLPIRPPCLPTCCSSRHFAMHSSPGRGRGVGQKPTMNPTILCRKTRTPHLNLWLATT